MTSIDFMLKLFSDHSWPDDGGDLILTEISHIRTKMMLCELYCLSWLKYFVLGINPTVDEHKKCKFSGLKVLLYVEIRTM